MREKQEAIKSATDNNGEFSTENDDIQMATHKPEHEKKDTSAFHLRRNYNEFG